MLQSFIDFMAISLIVVSHAELFKTRQCTCLIIIYYLKELVLN